MKKGYRPILLRAKEAKLNSKSKEYKGKKMRMKMIMIPHIEKRMTNKSTLRLDRYLRIENMLKITRIILMFSI